MTHRILLRSAASVALACATAGVLAAQSASPQTPSPSPQTPSPRTVHPQITSPDESRVVTATGCLKQEKDIPGRLAGLEDRTRSGEAFVLVDTRITNAAMPDSSSDAGAGATSSAAAAERARTTAPSGAPGVSGSGTSGTGSTSIQSSDRPQTQAGKGPAAVGPGSQTMYKVTGLPEPELRQHLNTQVEVRARLNTASIGGAAVRQPGSTMGREPASTPSASTPPPAPTQAPTTQADTRDERPPDVPELPELRAMTIRATGGRCQGT